MNNKKIKMIVVDLDGTLLTEVDNMSNNTVEIFKKVREAGIIPVVATGRLEKESVFAADMIGAKKYIITMNGLMIYDYEKDKEIYHRYMDLDAAYNVLDILDDHDIFYQVYADNKTHSTERAVNSLKYSGMTQSYVDFYSRTQKIKGRMKDYLIANNIKPDKMFLSIKDDKMRNYIRSLADGIKNIQTLSSGEYYLEILPKNADKCYAIDFLSQYTGILPNEMMIIGDSENDVKMLKMAGISVAMGNGCKEAKEIAHYIAPDNLNNGIAVAIDKFIFN